MEKSSFGKESYKINELRDIILDNTFYYARFEEFGEYDVEWEENDFNSIEELVLYWLESNIDVEIEMENIRLSEYSKEDIKWMLENGEIAILKRNRVIADFL
jgi:hypothetical protein